MEPESLSAPAPRIARLTDEVINQIAAGEVVERPASIIKELVENSLDANARRIDIGLREGGIEEIVIIDDGSGMPQEDLLLAVERHTTSKLSRVDDLDALATYGFRGEALSSVASVSEMEIRTRPVSQPMGTLLKITHGQREPLRPVASPLGTSLTVRELFKKIPARQKFLRASGTELSHCVRVVRELALGNPQVSFYVKHQGRLIHSFVSAHREARVRECLKPQWTPLLIRDEGPDASLEAYLSPADGAAHRGELLFFINQRSVRHKILAQAVRNGYQEGAGRPVDPSGVVYLEIRRDWVDVNVHPQKLEVRLLRQERLFQWIVTLVRKAVAEELRSREKGDQAPLPIPLSAEPKTALGSSAPSAPSSRIRFLGQFKNAYLVCEDPQGLCVIHQQALYERLIYQRMKASFQGGKILPRPLPVPRVIRTVPEVLPILEEHLDFFARLGFDIENFGEGDVAVKGLPPLLGEANLEAVLESSLLELQKLPSEDEAEDRVWAILARHSAVTAPPLSPLQAEQLVIDAGSIEESWTCPQGKPILFRLRTEALQKFFEL
jgi:DNA mismatch repair protein MutL